MVNKGIIPLQIKFFNNADANLAKINIEGAYNLLKKGRDMLGKNNIF
jgi:hypothetical protein